MFALLTARMANGRMYRGIDVTPVLKLVLSALLCLNAQHVHLRVYLPRIIVLDTVLKIPLLFTI